MIKLFEDWRSDNEKDPAVEKIVDQLETWAKSSDLEYNVSWYGKAVTCGVRMMGYWTLAYEKTKVKGGQDSMYRQTYETKDNYKWTIKFPGRTSQYNFRANTKPGNFKTFKGLVEKFMKVREKFFMVSEFLDLLDHEKFGKLGDTNFGENTNYSGKNLKDLECGFTLPGGTIYDRVLYPNETTANLWRARYRALDMDSNVNQSEIDLTNFDPETGSLFYYALLATRTQKEPEYDESLLAALEVVKDQPVEKVWAQLKNGDWESFKKKYAGAVAGKEYGV
jgi:hypothetical protein